MSTTLSKFKGGKELQDFLNTLPAKVENNILRSALRQGANVIKAEAKANINDDTGDLSRSVRVKTSSKGGLVKAKVEAKDHKAHWVEFGTEPHMITPKEKEGALGVNGRVVSAVNHPGAKPYPFMRPAADSKTNEAVVAVGNQIRKRLTKEGINTPAGLEVDDE